MRLVGSILSRLGPSAQPKVSSLVHDISVQFGRLLESAPVEMAITFDPFGVGSGRGQSVCWTISLFSVKGVPCYGRFS